MDDLTRERFGPLPLPERPPPLPVRVPPRPTEPWEVAEHRRILAQALDGRHLEVVDVPPEEVAA